MSSTPSGGSTPNTPDSPSRDAGVSKVSHALDPKEFQQNGLHHHQQRQYDIRADSLANLAFCLLGIGVLFPWNSIVSALDYFMLLYPEHSNSSSGSRKSYYLGIQFLLPIMYMYPMVITSFLIFAFHVRVGYRTSVMLGFFVFFLVAVLMPILSAVNVWLIFVLVLVLGIADAFCQGSLWSLASLYAAKDDPMPTTWLNTGMGIAGVIVITLRIISRLIFHTTNGRANGQGVPLGVTYSAYLYFSVSAVQSLVCIFLFSWLRNRNASCVQVIQSSRQHEYGCEDIESSENLLKTRFSGSMQLFRIIWKDVVCVFGVFFITLAIFPGFIVQLVPSNTTAGSRFMDTLDSRQEFMVWRQETSSGDQLNKPGSQPLQEHACNSFLCYFSDYSWIALILVLVFTAGDLFGKVFGGYISHLWPKSISWLAVVARAIVFVPIFVALAYYDQHKYNDQILLSSSWLVLLFLIIVLLLAITNGMLASIIMIQAPKNPGISLDQEQHVGFLMTFGLMSGLAGGGLFGYMLMLFIL